MVGIATSYYLGKAGVRATVIEKDAIAAHASGFAYGGLGPLSGAGIPGPMAELAQESFQLHKDMAGSLPEESGIDYEYKSRPSLSLAFDDVETSGIKAGADWQDRQDGFSAEWLDPNGLREVDSRISPDAVGGRLLHGLAEVEPYKFVLALAQAAERLGADVRHGVVTGLERSGSRVNGCRDQQWCCSLRRRGAGIGSMEWRRVGVDRGASARHASQGADTATQCTASGRGLLDRLVAQLCCNQGRWASVDRHDGGARRIR